MSDIIFTPAAVLDLLASIDELADHDISMTEDIDGTIRLTIGGSEYEIDASSVNEVEANIQTIEDIEDVNMDAYDEIATDDMTETIESGVIKEIGKTLLVGGLVRLTNKLLRK